jgi:hypothetical protein
MSYFAQTSLRIKAKPYQNGAGIFAPSGKRGRKRRASQLPDSRAAEEGWMIGVALAVSPGQEFGPT